METVTIIIETPKGKGLKYDFDPATGYFFLKKIMPAGMVFPFDFGFVPGTIGEDGDPVDVIVISEMESFPGCAMECRIIGALQAKQQERDGQTMRNDRYIAIPVVSQLYAEVNELTQFPKNIIDQLEVFFQTYNEQAGKKFSILERSNAKNSMKLLEDARQQTEPTKLIQVYLPKYQPDGKPFSSAMFQKVKAELTEKFGGLTIYAQAPAEGLWKEDEQHTVSDEIIIYEILAPSIDLKYWKAYKTKLQKQFKQEELLIRCSSISIL
jgi:inorganic pyrophosphatase